MKSSKRSSDYKPLNTAVLFLVFNRLETTKQVFDSIKKARPPRLYIAADGARDFIDGELQRVRLVRDYVISNIDWKCEVKTFFREQNVGCRIAVSGAIDWFFKNEEMGIILEDDCLPSQSFFNFCEQLLLRFKDDMRIWHIAGANFQNGISRGSGSYYFSKYSHIWGWASWSNRWKEYDVEMKSYKDFIHDDGMNIFSQRDKEWKYWQRIFQDVSRGRIDTWDYQWLYTVWMNNGLSILPNLNLISNIGFGPEATHTMDMDSQLSRIPRQEFSSPLLHPTFVLRSFDADRYTARRFYTNRNLVERFFNRIKRIFK